MPVTKTATRALRSSAKKQKVNAQIRAKLEGAIRAAKKSGDKADAKAVSSLADRAAKKNLIHANKASRIKSQISKITKSK